MRWMSWLKGSLLVALVFGVAAGLARGADDSCCGGAHALAAEPPPAASKTVTLRIEGMTCGGCATTVEETLRAVPGVIGVEVSFEDKAATVRYDAARVTPEKLVQAFEGSHYKATIEPAKQSK